MTVEHAFNCSFGGFPSIRHNELWDITASLLSEVCHNVRTEPPLQPLSGEQFHSRSGNSEEGARLDISAESFWGQNGKIAFFDVKVFSPLAASYSSFPLTQCYRWTELDKKRMHDEQIHEVERGTFTHLVFSCTGGIGPAATVVYKRLAMLISKKRDHLYTQTLFG